MPTKGEAYVRRRLREEARANGHMLGTLTVVAASEWTGICQLCGLRMSARFDLVTDGWSLEGIRWCSASPSPRSILKRVREKRAAV